MKLSSFILCLTVAAGLIPQVINAQNHSATYFPMKEGFSLSYELRDKDGKLSDTYTLSYRNIKGDVRNGGLDMVFNFVDANGKAIFDENNEFTMSITKSDGKTSTKMDKLKKVMKVQEKLPCGDPSSFTDALEVGKDIKDSDIRVEIGKLKAHSILTERKCTGHKSISVKAGTFDCWLVEEKITTTNPVKNYYVRAHTWYAMGVGIVRQTVYRSDGTIRCSIELTEKSSGK